MSDQAGSWDLYLLDISGGVQALVDGPAVEALPAWAPDGSHLAFLSNRDGDWGIYLMRPDGEDLHEIINLGTDMPDWQHQRISWAP